VVVNNNDIDNNKEANKLENFIDKFQNLDSNTIEQLFDLKDNKKDDKNVNNENFQLFQNGTPEAKIIGNQFFGYCLFDSGAFNANRKFLTGSTLSS
jgi:hypothetical protein